MTGAAMMRWRMWAFLLGPLAAVTLSAAGSPQAGFPASEPFTQMPTWDETYTASWNTAGGQVDWTIEPAGGAADGANASYLRGYRNEHGSSIQLIRYPVPQNTDLYVGVWMKCPFFDPTPGQDYWMEAGFKPGTFDASDFDNNGQTWTLIQKFDWDPATTAWPNGNGDVWTLYTAGPVNSGTNTEVSVAFKLGSLYGPAFEAVPPGPPVCYDGIVVSDQPITGGGGTGGGGGGTGGAGGGAAFFGSGGEGKEECGCGTIRALPAPGLSLLAALAALGLLFFKRRTL